MIKPVTMAGFLFLLENFRVKFKDIILNITSQWFLLADKIEYFGYFRYLITIFQHPPLKYAKSAKLEPCFLFFISRINLARGLCELSIWKIEL